MGIFVQLVTFSSAGGKFDEKKDTTRINEYLSWLQKGGARIVSVNLSVGGGVGASSLVGGANIPATCLITYEAPAPITG